MSSRAGTVILLVVIVLAVALTLVGAWVRDRSRADEEAHDPERIEPDPESPEPPTPPMPPIPPG